MYRKFYLVKKVFYTLLGKRQKLMDLSIQKLIKNGATIGGNFRLFSKIPTAEPYLLEFGNNVTVSTNVSFITHDNSVIKVIKNKTDMFGKITIGDNCFIGANTILLPGVTLGENTIVGAGSVVTRSFPEGDVAIAGNPAKVIKEVSKLKSNMKEKAFNVSGLSHSEIKQLILDNPEKLLER